jgi:hypothetical protein
MKISLDYDDTFTKDPAMWQAFIELAKQAGHTIYCVTMRYVHEGEPIEAQLRGKVDGIFYTGRQAKRSYMSAQGHWIDVWIDDTPDFILISASS